MRFLGWIQTAVLVGSLIVRCGGPARDDQKTTPLEERSRVQVTLRLDGGTKGESATTVTAFIGEKVRVEVSLPDSIAQRVGQHPEAARGDSSPVRQWIAAVHALANAARAVLTFALGGSR